MTNSTTIQDISSVSVGGLLPFNEINNIYIDDEFCCEKCNTILTNDDRRFWDIAMGAYKSRGISSRRICFDCFKTNKNLMKELHFEKYTRHKTVVEQVQIRLNIWRMIDLRNNENNEIQIVQIG